MAGSQSLSTPSPDLAEAIALRDLAAAAATHTGTYLRQRFGDAVAIEHKGEIDLVTEADRAAETLAIDAIRAERPDDRMLAEERGADGEGATRVRWIIDPLDGTTNFARALPWFAVSIAAEVAGQLVAGAIHVPMVDELFTVARGAGAQLNGRPIAVSAVPRLERAFLATGFPYDIRSNPDNNLDHFARFSLRALAVRRPGAAAIDLAYVACGRFDGFWELRLKPWDAAAGGLLILEAGGRITGIDGGASWLHAPGICASNGHVHDEMLAVLAMRDEPTPRPT
jgi:myo-inositol-1(or 4)-monophosphatase